MLSSKDLAVLLMFVSGGLFTTTLVFAIAWIRTRERAYRAELAARSGASGLESDSAAHLQRTVDSVALEVERIGEAQRFLTRVLAGSPGQRVEQPKLGEAGRVITPH